MKKLIILFLIMSFLPELMAAKLPSTISPDGLSGVSETISVIDIVFFTWGRFMLAGVLFGVGFFTLPRNFLGSMLSFISGFGIVFLPKIVQMGREIGGANGIF